MLTTRRALTHSSLIIIYWLTLEDRTSYRRCSTISSIQGWKLQCRLPTYIQVVVIIQSRFWPLSAVQLVWLRQHPPLHLPQFAKDRALHSTFVELATDWFKPPTVSMFGQQSSLSASFHAGVAHFAKFDHARASDIRRNHPRFQRCNPSWGVGLGMISRVSAGYFTERLRLPNHKHYQLGFWSTKCLAQQRLKTAYAIKKIKLLTS